MPLEAGKHINKATIGDGVRPDVEELELEGALVQVERDLEYFEMEPSAHPGRLTFWRSHRETFPKP